MTNPMPPGWYDNPDGTPNSERFWDGLGWTPESRPKSMPMPPVYPPAPDPYAPPAYPPPGFAQPPFPPPPYPMWQPQPPASNLFSIIAFVCAAISLLFCPIAFGPAGLILGGIGVSKKEKLAPYAMAAAGICMIVGMIIGFVAQRALLQ